MAGAGRVESARITDSWAHDPVAESGGDPSRLFVMGHSADAPPALLIYGSDDTTVDPGNSRRLAAALTAAGRPVELRVYPGLGHGRVIAGFSPPLARGVSVTDDVMRFIDSI